MTECVIAYCDGLCSPHNPGGLACGGWHILPHAGIPALADGLKGGTFYCQGDRATNNVAEYEAALDVLRAI
jgi:ribonuclease HI